MSTDSIYHLFNWHLGWKRKSNWSKMTNYATNWLKRFTEKVFYIMCYVSNELVVLRFICSICSTFSFSRLCRCCFSCKWIRFAIVKKRGEVVKQQTKEEDEQKKINHMKEKKQQHNIKWYPDQLSLLRFNKKRKKEKKNRCNTYIRSAQPLSERTMWMCVRFRTFKSV